MHRAAVCFHPSATRQYGLLGKNAELQRLSAGCRVRTQASVGAALPTLASRGQKATAGCWMLTQKLVNEIGCELALGGRRPWRRALARKWPSQRGMCGTRR